ncbi:MAG TPA: NfeD family protein [Pirellulales bacterium]|jgi:membrane-bound ClpP family serine protease|nr:NfeD family protein [Pirellulales bacterium]
MDWLWPDMTLAKHACGASGRNGVRRISHWFISHCLVWQCAMLAVVCFTSSNPFSACAADDEPAPAATADKTGDSAAAQKPAENKQPSENAPADRPDSEKPADSARRGQGFLVRVDLPITDDVDTQVRRGITQLLGNLKPGGPRPILVVELWPGQTEGGAGSDFFRSLSLAKFLSRDLRDLARGVKTVAYIPKTVKGHAVLVAMACEEIIMAPNAEIGEAGIDESVIGPTIHSGYKEIADARGTIPAAIALGMLDKNLKVLKVSTEVGTEYVLEDGLDELKKHRVVQNVEELQPRPLLVDGRQARQDLGFVSYLADDRTDVARALKIPIDSLQDNPGLVGGWRPVQVDLKRPITATTVSRVQKLMQDQIRVNDVNLVVLYIESDGGSYDDALRLVSYLAGLDSSKVRTVAYVPHRARGDAALIALACDQLVMGPNAKLGGEGADVLKADARPLAVSVLREALSKDKSRSWSLPAAMIDPELKVYRYTNPSTNMSGYFCEEELKQQRDPAAWKQGELVTGTRGPLQLTGPKAEQLGLAWKVVDNFEQFKQAYGLERNPAMVEPGWADFLIDALTSEGARMFLLIMIFVGVYLEVHAPGVGIGGFIALLSALLYFWAQHLQGNPVALQLILFFAGILCVALEIFVLPGLAIFGFGGGLMIIASLVLASQTFVIPGNEYQWDKLRNSLLVLGGAISGSLVAAVVIRRFLPHAPVFNRMMLQPPSNEEMEIISQREALADFRHLLGQQGVATTRLILSGKARIGDQLVDVIADGEAIDRGMPVTVVDVIGSRVVVRSVRA